MRFLNARAKALVVILRLTAPRHALCRRNRIQCKRFMPRFSQKPLLFYAALPADGVNRLEPTLGLSRQSIPIVGCTPLSSTYLLCLRTVGSVGFGRMSLLRASPRSGKSWSTGLPSVCQKITGFATCDEKSHSLVYQSLFDKKVNWLDIITPWMWSMWIRSSA
jgi:hypothetical protein